MVKRVERKNVACFLYYNICVHGHIPINSHPPIWLFLLTTQTFIKQRRLKIETGNVHSIIQERGEIQWIYGGIILANGSSIQTKDNKEKIFILI